MQGRYFRQVINKFMVNSEVANNARVQVYMPNGETFDVCGIQLMQNKIIGERESHRLIITVEPTQWHKFPVPCTKTKNFMKAPASSSSSLVACGSKLVA
jgi:hypothetical protein